ncbi:MAG: hypothetical protein NTW21_41965 [Verrucomicrobia bacterium]|nr:hypothetical protein [Verrucomicrobiota bacterium]
MMTKSKAVYILLAVLGTWCPRAACAADAPATPPPATQDGYVYSSFTGDGEDGLHLLTSLDGKTWRTVKNYASIFQQTEGLMRDPSICRGGDGKYHLVWTTGWWNDTIGISHSSNLIDWTPARFLYIWADYRGPGDEECAGERWPKELSQPAPRNPKVRNCWAPEIFYDGQTKEYVIFWATTIDDAKVFPKTWDAGRWERMNQRIYSITTKDFNPMTRMNDQFIAPTWVRHGTAFRVPISTVEALNEIK